jgi:hypothetical protein
MNHRYADCQNADPDDLGDCACMGTRSDLVREILDAEATIKRLEEERDEKIAMDADMAGAGCGRCRILSARLESAEAVVEAARKVERSATQRTSATIIGLGTLRAALAAHDASRPQPEGEVTK